VGAVVARVLLGLIPGTLLLARSHLVLGTALVSVALLCLCVISLVWLGIPGFDQQLLLTAGMGYVAMMVLSEVSWGVLSRTPRLDCTAIRLAHRQAAGAFLRHQHAEALSAAWRLCRLARHEPGAWMLLRQIAGSASDQTALTRAERELSRLRRSPPGS
jgi:hypothetical protein